MGSAVHAAAVASGDDADVYVASALVGMYARCSRLAEARRVFENMQRRDAVSWTNVISGYADNGDGTTSLDLLSRMECEGFSPDSRTLVAALKACVALLQSGGNSGSLQKGMAIHRRAAQAGQDSEDTYMGSALVDMYAKCNNSMDKARRVFDRILTHDVVSWSTLVFGYADRGEGQGALELLCRMVMLGGCVPNGFTVVAALKACTSMSRAPELGNLVKGMAIHSFAVPVGCVSEVRVANTLVDMYAKHGSMVSSRRVFDGMHQRSTVTWNALLFGYTDNGQAHVTLDLFSQMSQPKNALTYVAALKACGRLSALEFGSSVHAEIRSRGFDSHVFISASLIDFYGKCRDMANARRVFDSLVNKGLVAWTALLSAYSCHGDTQQVFELFEQMQEQHIKPDRVTLLCVLASCSHAGLVDKAKEYLNSMTTKFGLTPDVEHYTCIVDALVRSNRLAEAHRYVQAMPFVPNTVTWTALLANGSEVPPSG